MAGGTLYIDGRDTDIRTEGGAIVLRREGHRVSSVPMSLLERVIVPGNATFDARTVRALAGRGISLLFTSPRTGVAKARLAGPGHSDCRVRLAQYHATGDPRFCSGWASAIVRAKLQGQRRTLKEGVAGRPPAGGLVRVALNVIEPAIERLRIGQRNDTRSVDTVRGMEGAAAAVYFEALKAMFAPSLGFVARRRRPPPDPVNASLSLAYTLAFNNAANHAWERGLDPCVGFLHEAAWKRESLAADLVEPVRGLIDLWVLRMFASRTLRKEHFRNQEGGCFLGKAGREHFYREYESVGKPASRMISRTCTLLVRNLRAATPELENDLLEDRGTE